MNPVLKIALGWLGDFSAIFAADKVAGATDKGHTTPDRTAAVMAMAQKIAEAEKFDRAKFLMELDAINVDTNGEAQPILDLFDEFWKGKGVVWVGRGKERRSYRENQVGHLLQMIPIGQRQTEYVRLGRLLAKDRKAFFSKLEILNDDRFQQIERQLIAEFENSPIGKSLISAAEELAEPLRSLTAEANPRKGTPAGSLRNFRDHLRARALR